MNIVSVALGLAVLWLIIYSAVRTAIGDRERARKKKSGEG